MSYHNRKGDEANISVKKELKRKKMESEDERIIEWVKA